MEWFIESSLWSIATTKEEKQKRNVALERTKIKLHSYIIKVPLTKLKIVNNVTLLFLFTEAVVWSCSIKKEFLKIRQNSQENICVRVFFNKVANLRPAILLKKRL